MVLVRRLLRTRSLSASKNLASARHVNLGQSLRESVASSRDVACQGGVSRLEQVERVGPNLCSGLGPRVEILGLGFRMSSKISRIIRFGYNRSRYAEARTFSTEVAMDEPREVMEYDVVSVGGGPAGLGAAIRLKQLCHEVLMKVYKEHIWPRWLSTLRAADLDQTGTTKTPRQTLPDVQHAFLLNHQFEHEYETILSYPRGISTCSAEDLVFISDSLHDRIIIANGTGRVLDYIGSCAGFEDGPFDSARLRRPSSVVYSIEQNCLYIADCENHAIRRANLPSRMLDTVYPKQKEQQGFVQRWLRGLGFMKNSSSITVSNVHQISYPWHLSILPGGNIIAATQGFEKLWMIEIDTGTATVEPDQEPAANLKKLMESKSSQLENLMDVYETLASRGVACEGLLSSMVSQVAMLKSEVLVIDSGMHQVLRLDLSTGHLTIMQLTNLALLGVPAWWFLDDAPQVACSLERLHEDRSEEAITSFQVQPGRCLIGIDVALPSGTVLAEPLTDVCLWRQGRGSLVELSTFDGELMMQKVTAAQRYVDELYDMESPIDKQMENPSQDLLGPPQSPSGLPFYSSIDVSLGTGEVVFDAVLYLKRDKSAGTCSPPGFFSRNDSPNGPSVKVTMPSCQKFKDFPGGDLLAKHLHFRVKCNVSADAPRTSMMLVQVQL